MRTSHTTNLTNFNYKEWSPELDNITLAEYIWIDGTGKTMRSKTKVYHQKITKLEDLDWWTFDGSSTMQATTSQSEIYLKPVFFCKDPIRRKNSILVLCETYLSDLKTPARYNFRYLCEKIMAEAKDQKPWFGMEQEYFLFVRTGTTHEWPLGWPFDGFPYPQGRYYCSIGDNNAFGRAVCESHLRCCLDAGLKIAGINGEVAPGQWEYQVGIAEGIECGDHHWMSRYLLYR